MLLLFWNKSKIIFSLKDRLSFDVKLIKRIIRVGIPSFMENLILQGGFLVMQILIVSIGTLETAAYQIGCNVHSLAFMPIFGLAITTTTTVGQNLGKKKYETAEIYAHENRRFAILVGIFAGLIEFLLAEPLARMYSQDPEIVKTTMIVVRGFAFIEAFMGIEKVSAATIRSAGDTKYVLITSVIALWTFRIATAYGLDRFLHLGLYGIMIGIFLDFSVRALMYSYRMNAGNWKYLKV